MNSSTDNDDWQPGCSCQGCSALWPHKPGECDNTGAWYVAIHLVDACTQVEFGETRGVVCESCFTALVSAANAIIRGGMGGSRSPMCQGCMTPLVRLSNILTDIARV